MPPPPPDLPLSPAVLAALGLAVGCTGKGYCLTYADSTDPSMFDTETTPSVTPCLVPAWDSAESGDTAATATGDTGASRAAALDRLEVEGVLTPDVLARIRRRGG